MLLENTAEIAHTADTSVAAKPRQKAALNDSTLQALKPRDKDYKVTDGDLQALAKLVLIDLHRKA